MATQRINPTGIASVDTPALRAAVLSGDPVVMGPGSFLLDGSGSELLLKTRPAPLIGSGASNVGTRLVIKGTVPSTTDVIRWAPAFGNEAGGAIGGFSIVSEVNGQRTGRHGIHFDLSVPPSTEGGIFRATFEDIDMAHRLNGRGVALTNPTMVDGFFLNAFRSVETYDGFYFQRCGDSVLFDQCGCAKDWTFPETVPKCGIEIASMVLGANVVTIRDCNITSTGGSIRAACTRIYLVRNNIELVTNTNGAATAAVDLSGDGTDTSTLSVIDGGTIYAMNGTNAHALRLSSGTFCTVRSGTRLFAASAGMKDLYIAAGVSGTVIERNVAPSGRALAYTDLGTGTVFL